MSYKDIIQYELAEGITKEHLLKVAKDVVDNWMAQQPGFIKWEIHSNKENSFTDIVYWESEAAAKDAEKKMGAIPNGAAWFACYKEGCIKSQNVTLIGEF